MAFEDCCNIRVSLGVAQFFQDIQSAPQMLKIFAIRRLLMQDRYSIVFESHKLNEIKQLYADHEKEMTVIVYCLHTGDVATSYFQSQKKLTLKLTSWQSSIMRWRTNQAKAMS